MAKQPGEVYRAKVPKRKRYEVHYNNAPFGWAVDSSTYHTRLFAGASARSFASLGMEAYVVDTRASGK